MKRIIFVFMLMIVAFTKGMAQEQSADSIKPVLTTEQHIARMDSLMEIVSKQVAENDILLEASAKNNLMKGVNSTLITIAGIIFVFGMPVLIVFFVFFFRYKTRKAQYGAVVKALETGQSIPEELLLPNNKKKNVLTEGIMNIFTGLGLGIFLWALTGEFGIGCIGFMIMFIGIGQVIIYKIQNPSKDPFIRMHRDENTGEATLKFGGIELVDKKKKQETENEQE